MAMHKKHGQWLHMKSAWAMVMWEECVADGYAWCTCDGWTSEECSGDGYANDWWQNVFGNEIVYHPSCVCDSLPFMIEAKS